MSSVAEPVGPLIPQRGRKARDPMTLIGRTRRSEQDGEIDGPGGEDGEAPGLSRRRFAQLLGAGVAAAGGAGLTAAVPARAAALPRLGRGAAGAARPGGASPRAA